MGISHPSNPRFDDLRPGAIVIGRRDDKHSFTWWAYRVGEWVTSKTYYDTTHYWVPKEGRWLPAKDNQTYTWCGCVIAVYADPNEGQEVIDILQSAYDAMWAARRDGENALRVALKLVTQ